MLIEAPRHAEMIGSVRINEIQRILKLESDSFEDSLSRHVSRGQLDDIMDQMMIAVPVKDERINLLDGVLKAIPERCQICMVSNSRRKEAPSFDAEMDLVDHFYNTTRHPICVVHQKDEGLGAALREAGYDGILDEQGKVRSGKAEGMMVALLLAKHFKKKYIGYIDADNYVPGAVNEYVTDFSAGMAMANSPYTLVRLHWKHKPKIVGDELHFRKWGRVSETTNKYLNQLIAEQTRFGTEIMRTGNAGEHAVTMALAEKLDYSTGYSIEPYHIVHMLEKFGKDGDGDRSIMKSGIDIRQIETLNPHLHEEKGDEHLDKMLVGALSTIYHSHLSSKALRRRIEEDLMTKNSIIKKDGIPKNTMIPSIEGVDVDKFALTLSSESETYINMS